MRRQQRTNERERLKRYKPFTEWEKQVIEKTPDDDAAISIILRHREYLRENKRYISSIEKIQYRARFSPRNEKDTATMDTYYRDDFLNGDRE